MMIKSPETHRSPVVESFQIEIEALEAEWSFSRQRHLHEPVELKDDFSKQPQVQCNSQVLWSFESALFEESILMF